MKLYKSNRTGNQILGYILDSTGLDRKRIIGLSFPNNERSNPLRYVNWLGDDWVLSDESVKFKLPSKINENCDFIAKSDDIIFFKSGSQNTVYFFGFNSNHRPKDKTFSKVEYSVFNEYYRRHNKSLTENIGKICEFKNKKDD